jgi:hypothetical protein
MKFDNPDAIIRIRMEVEDHVDQGREASISELGWREGEAADIGWCVGVHVMDALARLFGEDHRLESALSAVSDFLYDRRVRPHNEADAPQ